MEQIINPELRERISTGDDGGGGGGFGQIFCNQFRLISD